MPDSDIMTETAQLQGRSVWRTVLTSVIAFLTLLATGTLLALNCEWGPFAGMEYDLMLLIAAPAILVLISAGMLWLVQVLMSFGNKQWRSWQLAIAPGIVVFAVVGIFVAPGDGFDDARPRMEQIAQEIVSTPGNTKSNIKIGRVDIARVEQRIDGAVYFIDADGSFGSTRGWIYAPNGEPVGSQPFISLTSAGGPWYAFEQGS